TAGERNEVPRHLMTPFSAAAPAASEPRPYAVETDKPPKTHRRSGRSGFTSSGNIRALSRNPLFDLGALAGDRDAYGRSVPHAPAFLTCASRSYDRLTLVKEEHDGSCCDHAALLRPDQRGRHRRFRRASGRGLR